MSFDPVKYKNEYARQNYKRIVIVLRPEDAERIRLEAQKSNKSINGYVVDILAKEIPGLDVLKR